MNDINDIMNDNNDIIYTDRDRHRVRHRDPGSKWLVYNCLEVSLIDRDPLTIQFHGNRIGI